MLLCRHLFFVFLCVFFLNSAPAFSAVDNCGLVFKKAEYPKLFNVIGNGAEEISFVVIFGFERVLDPHLIGQLYVDSTSRGVSILPEYGSQIAAKVGDWKQNGILLTMGFRGTRDQMSSFFSGLNYLENIHSFRLVSTTPVVSPAPATPTPPPVPGMWAPKAVVKPQPVVLDRSVLGQSVLGGSEPVFLPFNRENSPFEFGNGILWERKHISESDLSPAFIRQLEHVGAILQNKRLQGGSAEWALLQELYDAISADPELLGKARNFLKWNLNLARNDSYGTFFSAKNRDNYVILIKVLKIINSESEFYPAWNRDVERVRFLSIGHPLVVEFLNSVPEARKIAVGERILFYPEIRNEWPSISHSPKKAMEDLFSAISKLSSRTYTNDIKARVIVGDSDEGKFRVYVAFVETKLVILRIIDEDAAKLSISIERHVQSRLEAVRASLSNPN